MKPEELRAAMSETREAVTVAKSIIENFQNSGMTPACAMLTLLNATTAYLSTCPDPENALASYMIVLKKNLDMWRALQLASKPDGA